jgi:serine phosphatase RsbU (regulator of sigma subunit)
MTPDFFHSRLEACELTLSGGDTLILYTDGITEAQNAAHDEFGIERLVQTLKLNSRNNSNELVNTVMSDLDAFVGDAEQYDDITVVAVKWEGSAGTSVRRKSEGAIHAG